MDLATAISLYQSHCEKIGMPCREPQHNVVDRGAYWFFADPEPIIGRSGLIIRKKDSLHTVVGSGLGINWEMVFWAYERGLLTGRCDLVITGFAGNADDVIDVLTKTPLSQRGMSMPGRGREKWRMTLATLPAVIFADEDLYTYVHELWDAENNGTFFFEIRPMG